jgi:peptidoglycan/xylan/chitin deacetylase (PgdA/CDA1 family)
VNLVAAGPRRIAVTFDDGPHPEFTPGVLNTLRRYGVRATFCVVGTEVEKYPNAIRAIRNGGHAIASHSWSHPNMQELTPDQVNQQVERSLDAIDKVLRGYRVSWFRAPYGSWSPDVMGAISAAGMRPLGWSVDPTDFQRPGEDVIAERILSATTTGSIILNHDGGGDRSQTVAALDTWLPRLLSDGYRFVLPT